MLPFVVLNVQTAAVFLSPTYVMSLALIAAQMRIPRILIMKPAHSKGRTSSVPKRGRLSVLSECVNFLNSPITPLPQNLMSTQKMVDSTCSLPLGLHSIAILEDSVMARGRGVFRRWGSVDHTRWHNQGVAPEALQWGLWSPTPLKRQWLQQSQGFCLKVCGAQVYRVSQSTAQVYPSSRLGLLSSQASIFHSPQARFIRQLTWAPAQQAQ